MLNFFSAHTNNSDNSLFGISLCLLRRLAIDQSDATFHNIVDFPTFPYLLFIEQRPWRRKYHTKRPRTEGEQQARVRTGTRSRNRLYITTTAERWRTEDRFTKGEGNTLVVSALRIPDRTPLPLSSFIFVLLSFSCLFFSF